jgi:hypothetical protein
LAGKALQFRVFAPLLFISALTVPLNLTEENEENEELRCLCGLKSVFENSSTAGQSSEHEAEHEKQRAYSTVLTSKQTGLGLFVHKGDVARGFLFITHHRTLPAAAASTEIPSTEVDWLSPERPLLDGLG